MIFRIMFTLLGCLIFLFLTSCDLSKPEDVNKAEIEQILDQMKVDFRQLDLDGIMSYYRSDYLHSGSGLNAERTKWQTRMNTFSSFDFVNLSYDINEDSAVVSGTSKWITTMQVLESSEPQDNGDFSYFLKENGIWKIYGNHQLSVTPTVAPSSGGR
jgi:hypothetical protein